MYFLYLLRLGVFTIANFKDYNFLFSTRFIISTAMVSPKFLKNLEISKIQKFSKKLKISAASPKSAQTQYFMLNYNKWRICYS
jgi:hypothetical protein